ncbi:hypothetical protein IW492_05905 [Enterococcus sp. BWB1-3]|uniref:hypothetical protein n=1 Tax=Enterococcus sp. BWB1-3 TaxID=2787713 RepID=UPI001920A84B|nr:hypothetical protein [Enterococcus sp. BWB1-3]MBL1228766.1 hypothetical protein [Enterococcus sp. BWB1-3]
MAQRNWEHNPLFFYNAIRAAVESSGLSIAESPETYEGELPYAWIDQINFDRTQVAVRSSRQGDVYDYSAVVHVFFPWDKQGDMLQAVWAIDGAVQQSIRCDLNYRIIREQDGTIHCLLNIK